MKKIFALTLLFSLAPVLKSQNLTLTSPDRNLVLQITNNQKLEYSVSFKDRTIVNPSMLGFEFRADIALITL